MLGAFNLHDPAFGRMLDGVGQQIGKQLLQPVGIAHDALRPGRHEGLDGHAMLLGKARHRFARAAHQRADLHPAKIEFHLAGFDLLDVQDVVDEADQAFAIAVRDPDQAARLVVERTRSPAHHQSEGAADGCQRRAQFMTDCRDELGLHPLGTLAPGNVADRRDEARGRRIVALDFHAADGHLRFEGGAVGALAGEFLPPARTICARDPDSGKPAPRFLERVAVVH